MTCLRFVAVAIPAFLLVTAPKALADPSPSTAPPETNAPGVAPAAASPDEPGFNLLPTHHFQWAGTDEKDVQVAVNFGLLQLALDGFNIAGEVRYRRWWFEYSHGVELTLNQWPGLTMTGTEREQNLHIHMPYTTGFGVGYTLLDELWLGVEFKTHRYQGERILFGLICGQPGLQELEQVSVAPGGELSLGLDALFVSPFAFSQVHRDLAEQREVFGAMVGSDA